MTTLLLGIGEPFSSPAWGSNLMVFSSASGEPIPENQTKSYLSKSCRYAKHYGVYLVPERFMMLDYQCMCLISPEGKVLGAQRAIYRNLDNPKGIQESTLDVISTEFGNVFLCVDVDIYHPEILRLAANIGTQIVICSQQIADMDYSTNMVVSGVWGAAQENNLFSVGVSNHYHCVCAPHSMSPQKDGFLVSPTLKMPTTAKLNADRLSMLPGRKFLSRRLYAMHKKEMLEE